MRPARAPGGAGGSAGAAYGRWPMMRREAVTGRAPCGAVTGTRYVSMRGLIGRGLWPMMRRVAVTGATRAL
eukprot:3522245-Prymnesium_polylepis.1